MTDMKSFKIGDQQKPGVQKPGGKKADATAAPASSAGFPRIEGLVESAKPDLSGLEARTAQLAELAAKPGASNKDKAAAKKAVVAYERAKDLVEYLLDTKAKMQGGG
jgi:hypothetical protein